MVVAASGEEGLFQASAETFDLLVIDLMLPGRNGIEILSTLRRQGIPTPVLIVTAKDEVEDRVLGLASHQTVTRGSQTVWLEHQRLD